jgi:putative transposase
MPRFARIRLPGYPLHIWQRGNNRGACFVTDADRTLYLGLLGELSTMEGCAVHAYVLMTNHVHLLLTPSERDSASELMRRLGQRYAQHFNRTYKRTGALWESRFKSNIVDSNTYLMRCQRYVERNPVRAAMVSHPSHYRWSSYASNADREPSLLIQPHATMLALGSDVDSRRATYRRMLENELTDQELFEIRVACRGGFALGSKEFVEEIGRKCGHRAHRALTKTKVPVNRVRPILPDGTCDLSPVLAVV